MKNLLILSSIFSMFIFYGCKTNLSDTSLLVETNGKTIYLFGLATGVDKTPLICRFSCSNIPTQQTKGQLCTSPIYITKTALEKSEDLSLFLEEIESSKVYVRKITNTEKNAINNLYLATEKKGTYDADTGDPDKVCSTVLNPTNIQILPVLVEDESSFTTGTNIKLKDLFSCNYITDVEVQRSFYRKSAFTSKRTSSYKGFIIKGSANECINKNLLSKYSFHSYSINHPAFSIETEDTIFLNNMDKLVPNTHYSLILMSFDDNFSNKNKENGEDELDINSERYIHIMYHNFTYNSQNQESFSTNSYGYLDFGR